MHLLRRGLAVFAVSALSAFALGDIQTFEDCVVFTSDLEANKTVTLPSFNTMGGLLTLVGVTVDVTHDGGVDAAGDNDDEFQGVDANARVIRTFTASGPGVGAFGNKTINSPFVTLSPDNGDLGNFDSTPPDGVVFGSLFYTAESAGTFNPAPVLYATPGPGSVNFDADVILMVNDNQFLPTPPDAWQLEVENPYLNVCVKVTYEYTPEPATLALLGLGALAAWKRRRS